MSNIGNPNYILGLGNRLFYETESAVCYSSCYSYDSCDCCSNFLLEGKDEVSFLEYTYIGDFSRGKFNGYGTLSKNGKKVYEGEWENGLYCGIGTLFKYVDNLIVKEYEGRFQEGKKNGCGKSYYIKSTYIWQEGIWQNDHFVRGKTYELLYHPNSTCVKYHGEALEKKTKRKTTHIPEGKGCLFNIDGVLRYSGSWKKGVADGQGIAYNIDGSIYYDGEWKKGNKYGYGTFYDNNVFPVYIGFFKKNIKQGDGVLFDDTGNVIYQGKFSNNVPHGKGTLFFQNGQKSKEGTFKNGKLHGKGIIYDENGNIKTNGKFINGNIFEEELFAINHFLETNDVKYIKKVTKNDIIKYVSERYDTNLKLRLSKNELIHNLQTLYKEQKNQKVQKNDQINEDLFGNTIETPCIGDDGETYDISSMNYLFEKNERGCFKNIPYVYENGISVPNFPITANGKRLTTFSIKN